MKRHIAAVILGGIVMLGSLTYGMASAGATKPDPEHKTSLCHRTASDTNPYVFITVDDASLAAHLNNLPGHPAKEWKSDGTFRGVAHSEGDPKNDYLAQDASECSDFPPPTSPPPTSPPPCEEACPTSPPPCEQAEEGCPTPPPTTTPPPSGCLIFVDLDGHIHRVGNCPTPSGQPTKPPKHRKPTPAPNLAFTGFDNTGLVVASGSLLGMGILLLGLAGIRRRSA